MTTTTISAQIEAIRDIIKSVDRDHAILLNDAIASLRTLSSLQTEKDAEVAYLIQLDHDYESEQIDRWAADEEAELEALKEMGMSA